MIFDETVVSNRPPNVAFDRLAKIQVRAGSPGAPVSTLHHQNREEER